MLAIIRSMGVNRKLLTLSILAALMVGCAASAMHMTDPIPAGAQAARAGLKPNTVTPPCYKPGGTDCASTFHFVHGQITLNTYAACANGNQCGFTGGEALTGNAIFANTMFNCFAHGIDANQDGVVMQALPNSYDAIGFGFRNLTGSTIPNNTAFTIDFTCAGA